MVSGYYLATICIVSVSVLQIFYNGSAILLLWALQMINGMLAEDKANIAGLYGDSILSVGRCWEAV